MYIFCMNLWINILISFFAHVYICLSIFVYKFTYSFSFCVLFVDLSI